jgi:putative endonuclease
MLNLVQHLFRAGLFQDLTVYGFSGSGITKMNEYFVYIVTNKSNKVLYIGVANNLERRMFEHKNKMINSFTKKYNLTKLVYFEETSDVRGAIEREKQLKNWHRDWKIKLITDFNPEWKDLSVEDKDRDAKIKNPARSAGFKT